MMSGWRKKQIMMKEQSEQQSQVEEMLRYEIDALEEKLAECRTHKRTWVGLTEDNVCKNLLADGYNTEAEFMRAVHLVEATDKLLKEKNGYA